MKNLRIAFLFAGVCLLLLAFSKLKWLKSMNIGFRTFDISIHANASIGAFQIRPKANKSNETYVKSALRPKANKSNGTYVKSAKQKLARTSEGCPYDLLPWDNVSLSAANSYVLVKKGYGRFGNNLFQYAAQILYATRHKIPLYVDDTVGNAKKIMPCFRTTRGFKLGRRRIPNKGVKCKYCQDLEIWRNLGTLSWAKTILGQAFFMPACEGVSNIDLTVYYRRYNDAGGRSSGIWNIFNNKRRVLGIPHRYVRSFLPNSSATQSRMWIVTGHKVATEVFLQKILKKFNRVSILSSPSFVNDFCFLKSSPRIVLTPSTFGWWAAFLSASTDIHYPILPTNLPIPWCDLIPAEDLRYTYDDLWIYPRTTSGLDSKTVQYICKNYTKTPVDIEGVNRMFLDR